MSNQLRIKRRITGSPGAPSSLLNAELAYNEVDQTLYYGQGISTGVTAAAVIAIGGPGTLTGYAQLAGAQTFTGDKTFTGALLAAGATSVTVPTTVGTENSTKAASTAFVKAVAQPLLATLTALGALAGTGFITQTGASSYAERAITTASVARITVNNGDGVAGAPTLDLATTGVSAGTFSKITLDVYGRATTGAQLAVGDITTALGFTPENLANKGVANGYAGLDATGKVPSAQLPASVAGGLNYQGVWNAATNTPTLVDGTGTKGFYYKVSVAGSTTVGGNTNWTVGDSIVYNGATYDKFEGGSPDVSSVAGKVGAVTLVAGDIGGLGTMATQNASGVAITGGTIASSTLTGTVAVSNGGTGAATLTGYVKGTGTTAMTANATIPNTDITGLGTMSTQNAASVNITGGTVAGSTVSGNITGSAANVTGTVVVANGGTGAVTLTGYVKGTGTSALTAAATIPNTDISGLGTMSVQNASAVAITGGTIDNTIIEGGTF
jgi:hypothetical protein